MFAVTCGNNITFFDTNELADTFMTEMIALYRKTAKNVRTGKHQMGFTSFEIPDTIKGYRCFDSPRAIKTVIRPLL